MKLPCINSARIAYNVFDIINQDISTSFNYVNPQFSRRFTYVAAVVATQNMIRVRGV